jgi:DNA-binding NarL/FixJ family response regulator
VTLDRLEPAVRIFAAVRALRAAVGAAPVSRVMFERQPHELAFAKARDALDARRFAAAWATGSALSLDAAVAEATALARHVLRPDAPDRAVGPSALTARERQVLPLLIAGRSDREIAVALFISTRTASDHVGAILRKLGAATRAEAAVRAVRDGLV